MTDAVSKIKYPEWLPFNGTAEIQDDAYYILRGHLGGAIRVAKNDVVVEGDAVAVRDNVSAEIVEQPLIKTEKMGLDCPTCPTGNCACIGCIKICCGSGGTRGMCIGVVGC